MRSGINESADESAFECFKSPVMIRTDTVSSESDYAHRISLCSNSARKLFCL